MPRKKKSGDTPKLYFGELEEKAVFDYVYDYIHSGSFEKRNKLYNTILEKPFRRMIESILRRYPIHIGNYETGDLEVYATSHLIEHMVKYRPFIIEYRDKKAAEDDKWLKCDYEGRFFFLKDAKSKLKEYVSVDNINEYRIFESKAFSYCQTIVRNYFKDHGKKSYSEKIENLAFEDFHEEIEKKDEYMYEIDHSDELELQELIDKINTSLRIKIDTDKTLKKNEIIVGEAIINVMANWNILFLEDSNLGKYGRKVSNNFAKNKILLYLKEQTNLSTKEIRSSMKQFRELYFLEKNMFFNES
jgi:predicted nucleic acid-binding Zn finger protein